MRNHPQDAPDAAAPSVRTRLTARRRPGPAQALEFERVWHELRSGPSILRGVSLRLSAGERVALMGRNGAGKSTLLRHAAGLMSPTRGRVSSSGRVALLLQNPGDYLVHELVAQEASPRALAAVGLAGDRFAARHPRELSGGERQRLALAIVLGDGSSPPRWPASTSRRGGWTATTETSSPPCCAGSTPPCWSPPTIPSSWRRSPTGWC